MIDIECKSISDYLICFTGLCGICEKTSLMDFSPTPAYAEKVLKRIKDERILLEKKTPRGKIIRLGAKGYEILSQIPPLKSHYDLITDHNQLRTDTKNLSRFMGTGSIISEMIRTGIPVNGITLKYTKQTAQEKGSKRKEAGMKNPLQDTYIKETANTGKAGSDFQEPQVFPGAFFIPGQTVKRDYRIAGSTNQSRARGLIAGDGFIYAAYFMDGPMKFQTATESGFSAKLFMVYEKLYGREKMLAMKRKQPNGSAIIFVNTLKDTEKILDGTWNKGNRFLTDAYSHVYIVPVGHGKISMYLADDFRALILKSNYYEEELEKVRTEGWEGHCDAIVKGSLSYELLSMDLATVNRIERTLKATEKNKAVGLHILCDSFQGLLIRDYFKNEQERVSIEEV